MSINRAFHWLHSVAMFVAAACAVPDKLTIDNKRVDEDQISTVQR